MALTPALALASVPAQWPIVLLCCALLVLGMRRWQLPVLIAVAGLLAWLGGEGMRFAWPGPVLAVVSLGLSVAGARRGSRLPVAVVAAVVAVALMLVRTVLLRTGWAAEAELAGRHAVALVLGLGAGLGIEGVLGALRTDERRRWRSASLTLAGLLSLVAVRVGSIAAAPPSFPGWSEAAWRAEADRAAGVELLAALEHLQAAGFRDAGLARVGLLAESNADVAALRQACRLGRRSVGAAALTADLQALGEIACGAVGRWPEAGARALLAAEEGPGHAARLRLAADLLMEAGRIDEALARYAAAAARGDGHALRAGVRALLDRGRNELAARFAAEHGALGDARVHLWLADAGALPPEAPQPSPGALLAAWNALLDFTVPEPAQRRGMVVLGRPGELRFVFDTGRRRLALQPVTQVTMEYVVGLPLPPDRKVPESLEVSIRNKRGFRLAFATNEGALAYGCNAWPSSASERYVELPAESCDGSWQTLRLRPAAELSGELSRLELAGVYLLEYLRIPGGGGS